METTANNPGNNDMNEQKWPQVFTPTSFEESDLKKQVERDQAGKILARSYRMIIIAFIPAFLFITIFVVRAIGTTVSIITIYGYGLLFMYIGYMVHLMMMLGRAACNGHSLYRIYSINTAPSDWSYMLITYRQLLFKKHPIVSISEFSAIGGGLSHDMLLALSSYNWGILMCGIGAKLNACDTLAGDDIIIMIGAFGLVLIGTFELDPFNKGMILLHSIGAILCLGTVVGYTWQQIRYATLLRDCTNSTYARLWSPILLDIIAVVAFVAWRIVHKKADNYGKSSVPPESKKVSRLTLQCVITEAMCLYAGAIAECLWLIFYDYYPSCNGVSDKSYSCFTKRDYKF